MFWLASSFSPSCYSLLYLILSTVCTPFFGQHCSCPSWMDLPGGDGGIWIFPSSWWIFNLGLSVVSALFLCRFLFCFSRLSCPTLKLKEVGFTIRVMLGIMGDASSLTHASTIRFFRGDETLGARNILLVHKLTENPIRWIQIITRADDYCSRLLRQKILMALLWSLSQAKLSLKNVCTQWLTLGSSSSCSLTSI